MFSIVPGALERGRCGKQNAEEIENAALLKPLPVHTAQPFYGAWMQSGRTEEKEGIEC